MHCKQKDMFWASEEKTKMFLLFKDLEMDPIHW